MKVEILVIFLFLVAKLQSEDAPITEVHLVNNDSRNMTYGRVEVRINGVWGTICDAYWDNNDATVVCRSLGYNHGGLAVGYALYGKGSGPILLDEVECSGSETSLNGCEYNNSTDVCGHDYDAGVVCYTSQDKSISEIRLVNDGENGEMTEGRNYGRVEVKVNGVWGTICGGYHWEDRDANVICSSFGFKHGGRAVKDGVFGQGSGPIWLNRVRCSGHESNLNDCRYDNTTVYCGHQFDAGVVCPSGPEKTIEATRLVYNDKVETNYGRVEVLMDGLWGTVCSLAWTHAEAAVTCRDLGFNYSGRVERRAIYGRTVSPVTLNSINCTGDEDSLSECSYGNDTVTCDLDEIAGVLCYTSPVVSIKMKSKLSLIGGVTSDITCQTSVYIPRVNITWFVDGKKINGGKTIDNTDGTTTSILKYTPTKTDYNKILLCSATNGYGTNETDFILLNITKSVPDPPSNITISHVGSTTVCVKWKEGYNSEDQQAFIVQSSTDDKTWTNSSPISTESYCVENLHPDTLYYVRVVARNRYGDSRASYLWNSYGKAVLTTRKLDKGSASVHVKTVNNIGLLIGVAFVIITVIIVVTVCVVFVKKMTYEKGSSSASSDLQYML